MLDVHNLPPDSVYPKKSSAVSADLPRSNYLHDVSVEPACPLIVSSSGIFIVDSDCKL